MRIREKKVYYGLAFSIPVLIILLGFIIRGIAPFGDACLVAMDAWGQYVPMLKEMKRAILSGDFIWSFNGLLGFNLWAQNAYYTSSPLWLLLYLLPKEMYIAGIDLMVALKIGLCGATFAIWINYHYKKQDLGGVALSCAYAMSAYTIAFMNQFMWMDVVVLLPLVILGLEKLVYEKRPAFYTLMLSLSIWCNFYIGYMVCLFCVVYFLIVLFDKRRTINDIAVKCVRFGWFSLLAGGMNAVLLIPAYMAIQNTGAGGKFFEGNIEFYHSISEIVQKMLPFQQVSRVNEFPNIYCSLICVLLFCLAMVYGKIARRKKVMVIMAAVFLLLSLNVNVLDFIWHGFHYPNQLPGRESFVLIFLILTYAYPGFRGIAGIYRKKGFNKYVPVFLACIIITELAGNALYCIATQTWSTSASKYTKYDDEMDYILEKYQCDTNNGEFYRIERAAPYNLNNCQLYGYKGITYYSSTMPKAAYDFFNRIGQEAYADLIVKYDSQPVTNSIFAVKYLLCFDNVVPKDDNLVQVETIGDITVLENKAVLPFAFMVDEAILEFDMNDYSNMVLQDEIISCMCGIEDIQLARAVEVLKNQTFEISKFENEYIAGTVVSNKGGVLYTSLPADDGWTVKVDGNEVEVQKLFGYLCGVKLTAGEHQVEFVYNMPGLGVGLLISVICLFLMVICVCKKRK